VACIVAGLQGAAVVGGISALGAALASVCIPVSTVVQYETQVKNGKLLLIVHGTYAEVERAKDLLKMSKAATTTVYAESETIGVSHLFGE
jgi:hypothetical protein